MVSYLVSTVFSTKNADSFFLILTSWSSWKTLDWGGKGGGNTKVLVIVDYEKAFLYVEVEVVSLPESVFNKQAQQIENTFEIVLAIQNTFEIYLLGLFTQNTFVFWHTPNNCYRICTIRTLLLSNNSKTKDDLRPHWPPPLPLSAPCWRRRHRCHGCRVVATIATVAIAAATATAAAISAATSTVSAAIATAFWLIVVCPFAASALATVACPCRCRHWLSTPLPLSPLPQTAAPCSFRRNRVMFKILHLK